MEATQKITITGSIKSVYREAVITESREDSHLSFFHIQRSCMKLRTQWDYTFGRYIITFVQNGAISLNTYVKSGS